ncbi:MAG: SurA N-terminal domain-containing protein [Pseudomonadota bacterium]
MLQAIREKFIGWAMWTLIGIIIVPFAFFGIETFRTGDGDPQVAKVGSQRITQSQLSAAYDQRLRQLQQLMGDKFNPSEFDQNKFREAILKDLVQESLLRQFVSERGFRAGDAQVAQALQEIPAFQDKGAFSSDLYRARLANMGYTPERFETTLRESLVSDQLRDSLVLTAFETDQAAAQSLRLAQQKRSISYALLAPERFRAQAQVTDAQIRARYDERKTSYLAPERIRVAYLELSLEALPKSATPDIEVLKAMYETEKATRYTRPEERQARHILIPFGADKAAAQKQAEALAAKLKNGGDFSALTAANSFDTGSKDKGGSLGWVKRGQMVAPFEKTLFDMGKGELSAPVETEFGWHLIRLDDLRDAQVRPFDDAEVQRELMDTYRARESEKRFQELSEKLETLAFESPGSLDPAAKALGLSVQTSDWLTRKSAEGLFANAKLIEAAFSEDVVKNSENSRPVSTEPGKIVVLRKQEYEAPRARPLAEVEATIRTELVNEAALAAVRTQAEAILSAARKGQDLQSAAAAHSAEFRNAGAIGRAQEDVPAGVRAAAFAQARPKAGAASVVQAELANGAIAIVSVNAVQDATPADASLAQEAQRSRDARAGAEFAAYRGYIEAQYKVKISAPPAETPAP